MASTPGATYRLQFHQGFTFREAQDLVPYLETLGVTDLYASPFLKARAGSGHGYDITDHNQLNPELGGWEDFIGLSGALATRGMGMVLDFVPNHMGVAQADNAWWLDVLEWGRASRFADYFDIDWEPLKPELRGKVLVPFLGDQYGAILEAGQLRLGFDSAEGSFSIWYWEHRFPVTPPTYVPILQPARARLMDTDTARDDSVVELDLILAGFRDLRRSARSTRGRGLRINKAATLKQRLARLVDTDPAVRDAIEHSVAAFNPEPGNPRLFDPLHKLLEQQNYRLAYWRVAASEINYRRFFQINDLAGIRVEVPEVFDAAHRLVLRLVGEGRLRGIRIDHIDGLFDPDGYLRRLQARAAEALGVSERPGGELPLYVVVEKILAAHERLREDWPIAGTTGYDVLNQLGGLFVEASAEHALERIYSRFIGGNLGFEEVVLSSKKRVMDQELAGELEVLANELNRLTETYRTVRDYTWLDIRQALRETVMYFPVYRTYVDRNGATTEDRRDLDWAITRARKNTSLPDTGIFDYLHGILTTDLARRRGMTANARREIIRLAQKFQQYTGPVMAKGMEDTAFYRYHRLISLNEVGGEPERFATTVPAFHKANQERAQNWPHAMICTATHDTKRGEDVRTRISVLSEMPLEWGRRVRRWASLNKRRRGEVDGAPVPAPNDEYLLYQTLVGAWPIDLTELGPEAADPMDSFRARITEYMLKAVREAKVRSSWTNQNTDYEEGLTTFIARILDVRRAGPFLSDIHAFCQQIAPAAVVNSLVQTALKLTIPGVPDIYQGTELWDQNLVDPDNRRPVDFRHRTHLLQRLQAQFAAGPATATVARGLLDHWHDGMVKLFVVWRLLGLRRQFPDLFRDGDYAACRTDGTWEDRVVAFTRRRDDARLLVIAPRLVQPLLEDGTPWPLGTAWDTTTVALADADSPTVWRNVLTDQTVTLTPDGEGAATLALATALADFPLAVLVPAAMTEKRKPT